MNLEAWLKEDHPLGDQLKVMEGICEALNEAHQKGVLHRSLEPFNIEVEGDGTCDLRGAIHADAATAAAAARYRAPEILEGSSYSPQADIYAVGVVFYEMLSGKSPSVGERPTALSDLRPDISRDLTDAVMGCLEKGPDWRPKDLSYLLQVVRTLRASGGKGGGRAAAPSAGAARPASRASSSPSIPARRASTTSTGRGKSSSGSGSNVPLIAAVLVLLVGAGVGAWFWLQGSKTGPTVAQSTPPPVAATPVPTAATPEPGPSAAATAAPSARTTPSPGASATPTPLPTAATALATPPPATPLPVATVATVAAPTPAPVIEATPTPAAVAETAPAAIEPAVLTAISPLVMKRGQTTILDIRGTNLRAEMQLRLYKAKGGVPTTGYSITRQRLFNPQLLQVLVKLEENAETGACVATVIDGHGNTSNGLPLTIAK